MVIHFFIIVFDERHKGNRIKKITSVTTDRNIIHNYIFANIYSANSELPILFFPTSFYSSLFNNFIFILLTKPWKFQLIRSGCRASGVCHEK